MRIPHHIGIIPDGNRRWAEANNLTKEKGYQSGIDPGLQLFYLCKEAGVKELTYYGFTADNTKRPALQKDAFINACIQAVSILAKEDAELLIIGNTDSPLFPNELKKYTTRHIFGKGGIKINFLVNYSWEWDLNLLKKASSSTKNIIHHIQSAQIARIDLIIRWGGRRRLSGFLPVQSIYADMYVEDALWPDFKPKHLQHALLWYTQQDVTLGG